MPKASTGASVPEPYPNRELHQWSIVKPINLAELGTVGQHSQWSAQVAKQLLQTFTR